MKNAAGRRTGARPALLLWLLSVLVGVLSALGVALFRVLTAFWHNLFFAGRLSVVYAANQHTPPSPWGPLIILAPAVGALGVAFLIDRVAAEARGTGVAEVIHAVYYQKGIIRPIVVPVKLLASALSIGSGAAVGREGPVAQAGAGVGSTLGQLLRMGTRDRDALIAAGAGAGVAAAFNAPVAGVLFAVELILPEINARTIVPVALAATAAAQLNRLFFGNQSYLPIASVSAAASQWTQLPLLAAYVFLGLGIGLAATLSVRLIYIVEGLLRQWFSRSYYWQHILGMLPVGLILYLLLLTTGRYYIEGSGYATIQDVLAGAPPPLYLLLLLFVLELVSTSLSLGSGASGGVFSPSLFMGAMLGSAYASILARAFPALAGSQLPFAVTGMAGMAAGMTGAALTIVVIVFEMTQDYHLILPLLFVVAISYGIRKALLPQSAYTMALARRGRPVPEGTRADLALAQRADQVMDPRRAFVPADTRLDQLLQLLPQYQAVPWFLVTSGNRVQGVVARATILDATAHAEGQATVADVATENYTAVAARADLLDVRAALRAGGAALALVVSGPGQVTTENVQGFITRERIAAAVEADLDIFTR